MGSHIEGVAATCSRCGFTTRAMVAADVTAAYPNRAAWSQRCWHKADAATPLACPDLAKAVRAGGGSLGRRLKHADGLALGAGGAG
jgi:hypothetical protein